jgi:hypothetical protein
MLHPKPWQKNMGLSLQRTDNLKIDFTLYQAIWNKNCTFAVAYQKQAEKPQNQQNYGKTSDFTEKEKRRLVY